MRPFARVLVVGACGGAGSTLLSGGLALCGVAAGRATQLLELDLDRGDLAGAWGVACDRTLADLLPVARELNGAHVNNACQSHPSGVDLLLSPGRPRSTAGWDAESVGALLTALPADCDLVIDGGSGLSDPARVAAHHVDTVLVVTPPTLAGARRALRVCEALDDAGARRPQLVVNRGIGASDLGIGAVGVAIGVPVIAVMPYSVREASDIAAGRRPRPRRGGLVEMLDTLAAALLTRGEL